MSTPLTPEDVRTMQFTTHRFKEGYDIDEVDSFLDGVHESMTVLVDKMFSLRDSCDDLHDVAAYWQKKYFTLLEKPTDEEGKKNAGGGD